MKKEIKPYSKKKSIIILIIGILGIVIAFASLMTGAIMQDNGMDSKIFLPFCIAFFPICIFDVVFLIHHYPGIVLREVQEQLEKKSEFSVYKNVEFDITELINTRKFKMLDEGYYYRKVFSFTKDYINYYVKKCSSTNIKETIDDEFNKFDSYEFKRSHKCLILFIEKDELVEDDFNAVSEISNVFISTEIVYQMINDISLIVLLDKSNKCAYVAKPGKNKLSFYNCGYKFIEKVLKEKR